MHDIGIWGRGARRKMTGVVTGDRQGRACVGRDIDVKVLLILCQHGVGVTTWADGTGEAGDEG